MKMNFIKKGIPLLFLAAPLPAASALSYLSGRTFNRSAQITVEQSKTVKQLDQAASFAAFGDRTRLSDGTRLNGGTRLNDRNKVEVAPAAAGDEVLAFLEQNNLLHPTTAMPNNQSGDLGNDFSKRFSQLVFLCDPDYYSTSSGCRITSITRQTPATSPTDADSLTWRLLFDVPVSGVGAADFTVSGTTATFTSVVQNSSTDYSMTLSGGNLASLNGTVSFELASTYDIRIFKTGALMESRGDDNINDGGADAVNGTNNNSYLVANSSPPTVNSVSASTANGAYRAGDVISIQLTFSEAVTVTGTPQLTLETGTSDQVVNYASGSGSTTLSFSYTVQAGDTSADLDYTNTSALALNGGTIRNGASENAILTLASPGAANSLGSNKAIVIDTTAPSVNSVNASTANGSYKAGDVISVQVNFSEAVTVTGIPQLTLETGTTDQVINYASGSGTSTLSFSYTIQAGDTSADLDYLSTGALALNAGTIRDAAANNATLTLASPGAANSLGNNKAIVIDTTEPSVSSVNASTSDGSYKAGDVISVQVNFSEAVTVTGTPQLTLETGTTDRVVSYASGSGTSTLTFNYTIQSGDISADLDYSSTAALALNAGAIRDYAGNNATLTLASPGAANSLGANRALVIDGTAPSVSSISRVTTAFSNASSVDYTITFSEGVTGVDTTDFTLTETGTADGTIASITPVSASIYTLTVNTITGDGTVRTDLKNSGTGIADAAGNAIATGFTSGQTYTFDHTAPTVTSVSVPANATYITGNNLDFIVNFTEDITVTTGGGTPRLTLTVGADTLYAEYLSGSGTNSLTFRYTVAVSNADSNGIALGGTIGLNGGTLRDAAGNDVTTTLNSVGSTTAVLVDAVVPTVTSVSVPANATYITGNNLDFSVNFNENVTVNTGGGTPYIALTLDTGGTVNASYLSGSGTAAITFRYTVVSGNLDSDGVSVGALNVNGGTIRDAVGNDILATLNSVGSTAAVLVDAVAPVITSSTPDVAALPADAAVVFNVAFDEAVTGISADDFSLTATGTAAGTVASVSVASGTSVAVTVNAISGTGSLRLNSTGTGLADAGGNAVPAYVAGTTHAVDRDAPAITGVSFDQALIGSNNQAAVSFTLSGAETTTTANYTITSSNGGTPVTGSVAIATSGQQITAVNVGGLNDGTLTVSLTLTDAAGNITSPAVTDTVVKDANAPSISTVVVANGSYREGDTLIITMTLDEDIDVVGTNSTLAVQIGSETRLATFVSENAGVITYSYTVVADENTDGTGVTVLANGLVLNGDTLQDAGGNDASLVFNQVSNPDAQVDTTTPADPVVTTPATMLSVNTPDYEIIGTHAEEGVIVNLYADSDNDGVADNTTVILSATVTGGAWSVEPILAANSANNYVVISEDAAGNVSATINVPTITHDDIAPIAPADLGLDVASDSGISATDDITNDGTPTITGTAEADATVTLSSDLDDEVGTAVADGAGDWSITTSALSQGEHTLTATATDAADNTGVASASLVVIIDTEIPTITDIANQGVAQGGSTGALAFTLTDNLTVTTDLAVTTASSNLVAVPLANAVLGGSGANRTVTVTGATPGASTITVTVEDVAGNSVSDTFEVGVNSTPSIGGTPAISVNQDVAYSFTPTAADVDGDGLTFGITNSPSWASFNTATGALTGTPTRADVGVYSNILISVSDGTVSANLPVFAIEVVYVNAAPTISGTPAASVDQDAPYSFIPTADDGDSGDTLTFSIANQPGWASFDTSTGALTGTPTVENVGDYADIVITVSDGELSASLPAFTLSVLATNVAPQISGTPPLTAYVGAAYSFTPTATDADEDELTFTAMGLPTWLTLNTATGQISGTPAAGDADMSYNIALSVSDGIETANLPVFSLTVEYDGADPVVTPPADITINAIGLYTPISLRQLLSLPQGTSPAAVQDALGELASDSAGGEDCCTTQPQGLFANLILLPPGRHEIVWRATNANGLTGEAVQVVNVRPRVSFSKHQVAVKGGTAEVRIILNGISPFYPLEIPYVIDPSSSASLADHDLIDGSVVLTEGMKEASFSVNLIAGVTAGDLELRINLDDRSPPRSEPLAGYDANNPDVYDINAGAASSHIISIKEGNVAPKANLILNQSGLNTVIVGAGAGPVTVTAQVTDPNPGDTHTFNWSATDARLTDTDGNASNGTFVFDPTGQSGLRKLTLVVTDAAGATDTAEQFFLVVPTLPVLTNADTDADGIDDLTEGTSDTSGNGIPDYLDNMPSSNVLPQVIAVTDAYLIECDAGVRCGIGEYALGGDSGGVQILDDEVGDGGLLADEDFTPVGGIFDFVIKDLPTAGQSVRIVIPQQAAIPADAVYRKFRNGAWIDFVEDANNVIHSTAGLAGYCPPPGDEDWVPGLVAGHLCVQLTIEDGGPNDADGLVNAAVVDPGAVSTPIVVEPPPPPPPPQLPTVSIDSEGKGGGAMGWIWLLIGGLLVLVKQGRLGKVVAVGVLAALSALGQAQESAADSKGYIKLSVYQAKGTQSAGDFAGDMAGAGYPVSLRDYDISRVAYRLSVGWKWTESSAIELGYLDLGDVTVNLDTTTTDMAGFSAAMEEDYPMSADGLTLSHRFGHHFTPQWMLSAEVGLFIWDGKISVDGATIDPDLGSGIDPLVGVQMDYQFSDPLSLGLGVSRVFFDGQAVDLIGLTGAWRF